MSQDPILAVLKAYVAANEAVRDPVAPAPVDSIDWNAISVEAASQMAAGHFVIVRELADALRGLLCVPFYEAYDHASRGVAERALARYGLLSALKSLVYGIRPPSELLLAARNAIARWEALESSAASSSASPTPAS